MKTLAIMLMVAGSLVTGRAAQTPVKWETSLEKAQKRAKAEHKLIFMDVWTEWCGWCIKLQKETFPSPEAQAALGRMVPLSLKTQLKHGEPTENKGIEARFKVDGFPMLIILDADGKEVARNPGFLPAAPFAGWVNSVASKK
jgi:thioredoxin-related protein